MENYNSEHHEVTKHTVSMQFLSLFNILRTRRLVFSQIKRTSMESGNNQVLLGSYDQSIIKSKLISNWYNHQSVSHSQQQREMIMRNNNTSLKHHLRVAIQGMWT